MNIKQLKLQKIIEECDKHILRMNRAYQKIAPSLPLDRDKYTRLSDDEVGYIDQYLFRFEKLQDTIGRRLFKAVFLFLEEDIEDVPFIDLLNRLEKLNILESAEQWLELRKIRNALSHTYEDEPEELSIAINSILDRKSNIENIYKNIVDYCSSINYQ
jgi:hypothetical protein